MAGDGTLRRHLGGRRRRGWRSSVVLLVPTLVVAVALSACSSSTPSASGNGSSGNGNGSSGNGVSSGQATKAPLDIGVIADLTGPDSAINVPQVNSVKAWAKVVNGTGGVKGHPVHLNICDAQSSETQSITCAQHVGDAGIVLENSVTGEMKADVPILASAGKVVITTDPTLNPPAGSNLFQSAPSIGDALKLIVQAAKSSGIKKIGVITTSDASGTAILGGFTKVSQALGEPIVSTKISPTTVTATTEVLQLVNQGVGMIYSGVVGATGAVVLSAMKTLDEKIPVVINASDVNPRFLQAAKTRPDSIYGVASSNFEVPALFKPSTKQNLKAFEMQYQKVTGHALDLTTVDFNMMINAQAAADVLLALGLHPQMAAVESYLKSHTMQGLGPLSWPGTGLQDASVPLSMAEAHTDSTVWAACVPSKLLQCS